MGTNYYWFPDIIKESTPVDRGLHIGKNSCGWVFQFEAHSNPLLKTVKQYREFLKEGVIYDEYEREISTSEFWEIVEDSKLPFNGREPYVLEDPNYPRRILSIIEWEDEGYAFMKGDFC